MQPLWERVWRSLKHLGMGLPYGQSPQLWTAAKTPGSWSGRSPALLAAAQLAAARTETLPRCPSTNERMKTVAFTRAGLPPVVTGRKPCTGARQRGETWRTLGGGQ